MYTPVYQVYNTTITIDRANTVHILEVYSGTRHASSIVRQSWLASGATVFRTHFTLRLPRTFLVTVGDNEKRIDADDSTHRNIFHAQQNFRTRKISIHRITLALHPTPKHVRAGVKTRRPQQTDRVRVNSDLCVCVCVAISSTAGIFPACWKGRTSEVSHRQIVGTICS